MPYFDYNATTPLYPEVKETWLDTVNNNWQNPSSPYQSAARVKNLLEDCRQYLADVFQCKKEHVIFNSGATEGNNAILHHILTHSNESEKVIISAIEHPSVIETAKKLFPNRFELLPVDNNGVVKLEILEKLIKKNKICLVSVMAANNECGAIQPWQDVQSTCQKANIAYHCDASQAIGKIQCDNLFNSDFVTGSAHKFGGPKGVGFLVLGNDSCNFNSLIGGAQEMGHRSGTENLAAIKGMITALKCSLKNFDIKKENLQINLKKFIDAITKKIPGLNIIGNQNNRLPNTVMAIMPNFENIRWVLNLDKLGFQISTGSACATGKNVPSHVLAAIGYSNDEIKRSVRISGGWNNSNEDWSQLANAFEKVSENLKNSPKTTIVIP